MLEAYADGYYAGLEGNDACPCIWPFDWWRWHVGNYFGHQALCAAYEVIVLLNPQD